MRPFFITALPRSGTTFLANFFTHAGVFCWHEGLLNCSDMDIYRQRMTLRDYIMVGDSDSGLVHVHKQVREAFPDALWIGIDRPPEQVRDSLLACGGYPGPVGFAEMIANHGTALRGCSQVIPFDTLFLTETLRNLWHDVTGLRFDARRAEMLADMRVMPNMDRYKPRYERHFGRPLEMH